jgi:hypothetical protein
MIIKFDVYSLSMERFVYFCDTVREIYGPKGIDEFFLREYHAVPAPDHSWDSWEYLFNSREKYVEFCLKWL